MSEERPPIELSEREKQVLELVVTGVSNKEIAQQLVISVNTVKVHLRNIFEKMGVQSRTEAALLAIQEKLVTVPASESEPGEAVETAIPAKTYLLAAAAVPLALPRWQQLYLLAAILLAAGLAAVPFWSLPQKKAVPNLPVLYAKEPTPAPAPPAAVGTNNRWANLTSMPTSRAGLALVAVDRRLFAIGGARGNNQATRSVEVFDTGESSWAEGASKPTAATNIAGAELNDKIYVPGGCASNGDALSVLEVFNPITDTWATGRPLPAARCGYGLAVYQGKLYLFGGWDGHKFVDTIFAYDSTGDNWKILAQKLPQPLGFAGAATLNNLIYIAGGYNGETEFNQTYAFNPKTETLEKKAPLQEKRGGLGLISGGNNLYAIGGGWQHESGFNEKYDPKTDTWTKFETPFNGQWRNLGLASIDTTMYAVGGWDGNTEEFKNSVVSYQFLYQLFLPVSKIKPK